MRRENNQNHRLSLEVLWLTEQQKPNDVEKFPRKGSNTLKSKVWKVPNWHAHLLPPMRSYFILLSLRNEPHAFGLDPDLIWMAFHSSRADH